MIAALFVETNGVYFDIDNVDPWDKHKDARLYNGSHPVIAHPPCNLWVSFAHVNYKRWGGEHNKPGNDGGCFQSALRNVRRVGGVLEHPAFSHAWEKFNLQKPKGLGWYSHDQNEHVCEIWQSAYGFPARKRTWLLYVGENPIEMRWQRLNGTHQIGGQDQRGREKNKPTISGKKASRTPIEFRDDLLRLARKVS